MVSLFRHSTICLKMNKTVSEQSSNTVLYHVMMTYREAVKKQNDEINVLKYEIEELKRANEVLATANRNGAELTMRKHEAGVMYSQCTDRFIQLYGELFNNVPDSRWFEGEFQRIAQRADFAHHMFHGINIIDLTGSDTEEDEDFEAEDLTTNEEFQF